MLNDKVDIIYCSVFISIGVKSLLVILVLLFITICSFIGMASTTLIASISSISLITSISSISLVPAILSYIVTLMYWFPFSITSWFIAIKLSFYPFHIFIVPSVSICFYSLQTFTNTVLILFSIDLTPPCIDLSHSS